MWRWESPPTVGGFSLGGFGFREFCVGGGVWLVGIECGDGGEGYRRDPRTA